MKSFTTLPTVVPWDLPPPDTHASSDAYRSSLATLYAFSEAPRSTAEVRLAREHKLDRMRALLGLLGSPQARFETILVAGTKGKGSMAAMLTSILHVAGFRVGRYTQPHLYSYRERTWARGRYVDEGEIVDALQSMARAVRAVESQRAELGPLTTFDVGTALSLLLFARGQVEVAVVEVGVGGANDATNALEPVLSLIGPVSLDHEDALGRDLIGIAQEKSGVLRRGIDAVVARQEPCVAEAIRDAAVEVGARLIALSNSSVRDLGCGFAVAGPEGEIAGLSVPLAGRFQRQNAAMAVVAAQLLARRGWHLGEIAIRDGLARVHWPGRFQTVAHDPLTIVDGAHNPYAARALADTIRRSMPERPLTLILGMSEDKDIPSTVAEVAPLATQVIVTRARHQRSCAADHLAAILRTAAPTLDPVIASSPGEALELAWSSQPPNGATVVTGSLFLVGDVLEWLLPCVEGRA